MDLSSFSRSRQGRKAKLEERHGVKEEEKEEGKERKKEKNRTGKAKLQDQPFPGGAAIERSGQRA